MRPGFTKPISTIMLAPYSCMEPFAIPSQRTVLVEYTMQKIIINILECRTKCNGVLPESGDNVKFQSNSAIAAFNTPIRETHKLT